MNNKHPNSIKALAVGNPAVGDLTRPPKPTAPVPGSVLAVGMRVRCSDMFIDGVTRMRDSDNRAAKRGVIVRFDYSGMPIVLWDGRTQAAGYHSTCLVQDLGERCVLLRCPFCGAKAKEWTNIRHPDSATEWNIGCENRMCRVRPMAECCETRDQAVIAWNTRQNTELSAATP